MLFVSTNFLFFFLFVYIMYWLLPKKLKNYFLLAASIYFYFTWSLYFTFHLILLIALNFYFMKLYEKFKNNIFFYTVLLINIFNLSFYKYLYFVAEVLGNVLDLQDLQDLRIHHQDAGYEIVLPLAVSFYTFQLISYSVDIKRGIYTEKHTLPEFLLYIFFFPQLIAGPIMRSKDLLYQIKYPEQRLAISEMTVMSGLWLILSGLIKKLFVADSLLRFMIPFYNETPEDFYPHTIWILSASFIMMLYADFSSYSDFARGFGYLFGYKIPINFKAPFLMHSFTELWKRWHLTFSSWIRDYIFIPLGGNRVHESRLYLNLLVTFLFAGLWHGASINFAFWGFLMGLFLSIEAFLAKRGMPELPASLKGRIFRISIVWLVYLSSGIFFYAPTWSWAIEGLAAMTNVSSYFTGGKEIVEFPPVLLFSLAAIVVFHAIEERPEIFLPLRKYDKWILPVLSLTVVLGITQLPTEEKDFFYFQF